MMSCFNVSLKTTEKAFTPIRFIKNKKLRHQSGIPVDTGAYF